MDTLLFLTVELSIRLVDDITDSNSGYLEILDHAGDWRRVCLDNWNPADSMVACRQLGYQQLQSNTSTGEHFFFFCAQLSKGRQCWIVCLLFG